MKKVMVFDEFGNFIEDRIEADDYETKENEYDVSINGEPEKIYKPKLVEGKLVEGLTDEEINKVENIKVGSTKSYEERIFALELDNAQLWYQILIGGRY